MSSQPYRTHNPPEAAVEALLAEQIREQKRWIKRAAALLAAVMLALGAVSWLGFGEGELHGLVGLCGVGLAVAAGMWATALGDPRKTPALRAFRANAPSLVWVYVQTVRGKTTSSWLTLGFASGALELVPLVPGREDEVLAAVLAVAPQATPGFSAQSQLQFSRDPGSLRRTAAPALPEAAAPDVAPAALLALLPYATAHLRYWRRVLLALGIPLLLLGLLGAGIVAAAASPRDQPLLLAGIFVVVAVLPGAAMTAHGLASLRKHPLVKALSSEPQRVRSVRRSLALTVEGDPRKMADVTLLDGRTYSFAVPS